MKFLILLTAFVFAGEKYGTPSKEYLKEMDLEINNRVGDFDECYRIVNSNHLFTRGDVTVQFTVKPDGSVKDAKVVSNTTGREALGTCVAGVYKQIKFNSPGKSAVIVQETHNFAPRR